MSERGPAAAIFEFAGAWDAIDAHYQERGWTDGLPIVPPTEAAVRELLRWTERDPRELIGILPPRQGEATVEKIAANAVMAGCRPEYFPVVLAAIEALADRRVQPRFRAGHHAPGDAAARGERTVRPTDRPARRVQRLRSGVPRQRHHRPGRAPGAHEYRRRPARQRRSLHAGHASQSSPTAWPRTRRRIRGSRCTWRRASARRQRGHRVRLRGPAQHPGPLQQHGRGRAAHRGRRHGPGRQQQPARTRLAAAVLRSRARRDRGPRRLQRSVR